MRKNFLLWLAVSVFIMLLLPWLAITFVKGDAGMAACFLLFFAVDPIYSVIAGIAAGKAIGYLWSLPLISAALFLAGTWIFFSIKETAFIMYAMVYTVLGISAMLVSVLVGRIWGHCET